MQSSKIKAAGLFMGAAAFAIAGATSAAHGALTLTLSEPGYAPATFTDSTNTAVSTFSGAPIPYGTFTTNIVVGSSNFNNPGPESLLQIQSLQVVSTTGAGHTLTISLTETGYTFPGAAGNLVFMNSSLGGTLSPDSTSDAITFQSTATATSGRSRDECHQRPAKFLTCCIIARHHRVR